MVLKDIECMRCGSVRDEICEGDVTKLIAECKQCGKPRPHQTLCRGGVRCITWGIEGIDPNDYIRHEGVKAGFPRQEDIGTANESKNATPIADRHGDRAIHERATFLADGLAERRDIREHARRRNRFGAKVQIG